MPIRLGDCEYCTMLHLILDRHLPDTTQKSSLKRVPFVLFPGVVKHTKDASDRFPVLLIGKSNGRGLLMEDNLHEVAKVMGVNERDVSALSKIPFEGNMMNPWGDEFPGVFRTLGLTPHKTVLDIPCGQGGVSVYLAREYGITVDGYDLVQGFVEKANEHAASCRVRELCEYHVGDIRAALGKGKEYDLLLWSAPPHIWEDYKRTIENLRRCVKHGGYLVIADAYLYSDEHKATYPDYETLSETVEAFTEFGDRVVQCHDYRDGLWAKNYRTDKEAVEAAIENAESLEERESLMRYLEELTESESADIECLGLYLAVLQIQKK